MRACDIDLRDMDDAAIVILYGKIVATSSDETRLKAIEEEQARRRLKWRHCVQDLLEKDEVCGRAAVSSRCAYEAADHR